MSGEFIFVIVILFLIIGIGGRLLAGGIDNNRVARYIEDQGGELLDKQWAPFGKGWFGEKDSRIYRLRYRDAQGNIHEATCKTSMLSGVYMTEDVIVESAQVQKIDPTQSSELDELRAENEKLRMEMKRLKDGS